MIPAVPGLARAADLARRRCAAWREDPRGVPRRPTSGDWCALELLLACPPTKAEQAAFVEAWETDRADRGIGGAIGITTFRAQPDPREAFWRRFDEQRSKR